MSSAPSRVRIHGSHRRPAAWVLCLVLLLVGCTTHQAASAGHPDGPQSSTTHQRSANPSSGHSPASTKALADRYLAIALPANRQLDDEVDSYTDNERDNLSVAEADLRKEVATEQWFDRNLRKIGFPPRLASIAAALVGANNQRIALTRRQSRARTLGELTAFDKRHKGADAAVEVQVRQLRKELGLPPPATS
jgi:hypothetical protein